MVNPGVRLLWRKIGERRRRYDTTEHQVEGAFLTWLTLVPE